MSRRRCAIGMTALMVGAAGVAACGTEEVRLNSGDRHNASIKRGADLFAARCAGCHTLDPAGAQGSAVTIKNRERVDGPNFNVRKEQVGQVLYAIRNGGFSGAIMPQNVAVGRDAQDVAMFVAKYAGREAKAPKTPGKKTQPVGGRRPETATAPQGAAVRRP
ncbi:MAG: c-type cytochrome [Solirubrobacteraceae bacterium]|jgi:mono/diheme cytochrome c family protein